MIVHASATWKVINIRSCIAIGASCFPYKLSLSHSLFAPSKCSLTNFHITITGSFQFPIGFFPTFLLHFSTALTDYLCRRVLTTQPFHVLMHWGIPVLSLSYSSFSQNLDLYVETAVFVYQMRLYSYRSTHSDQHLYQNTYIIMHAAIQ